MHTPIKVAKQFRWEAAHRLPWHEGDCNNLHGHSYRMMVEFEGLPNTQGMLIDFKDIKQRLSPLVDRWDHAILVAQSDDELLKVVQQTGWKHALFPYDTTAENLCRYVATHLQTKHRSWFDQYVITTIRVQVRETETCYAEIVVTIPLKTTIETDHIDLKSVQLPSIKAPVGVISLISTPSI